jgi:hypothetical protein
MIFPNMNKATPPELIDWLNEELNRRNEFLDLDVETGEWRWV